MLCSPSKIIPGTREDSTGIVRLVNSDPLNTMEVTGTIKMRNLNIWVGFCVFYP
jgi:hypothetical protein